MGVGQQVVDVPAIAVVHLGKYVVAPVPEPLDLVVLLTVQPQDAPRLVEFQLDGHVPLA